MTDSSTANFSNVGSGNPRDQWTDSLALTASDLGPKADTLGNSVSFTSRYASLLGVDRTSTGGSSTDTVTSSYTISFKVNTGAGTSWTLVIDTSRLGALTRIAESNTGAANIGAITGTLKADGGAKVDNFDFAAVDLPSDSTAANTSISQSSTLSYGFIGSHTFDLSFTWVSTVTSSQEGTAIRLGLAGSIPTTAADDYPGVGSRTASADGHFVDITAQIPFPATLSLLVAGTIVSGGAAWRKRRRLRQAPGADAEVSDPGA